MRFQRYRWGIALLVAVLTSGFLLFWTYQWLGDAKYGGIATIDETINRRTQQPAPEITSSIKLSQTFVASDDYLTSIQLFFGTYMRRNTADINVTITDESGDVISDTVLKADSILDNAWRSIVFERVDNSRGQRYEVVITSPEGREDNAFTAWTGICDCYPAGEFAINGVPQENQELVMRVSYHRDHVTTWRELMDRMSQYKPPIFKGAGLLLLAALGAAFSLGALGVLTYGVASSERKDIEERANVYWIGAGLLAALVVVLITGAYEHIL